MDRCLRCPVVRGQPLSDGQPTLTRAAAPLQGARQAALVCSGVFGAPLCVGTLFALVTPAAPLQGARQVKAAPIGAESFFVFVKPPSLAALEARLRGRGTEAAAAVDARLAAAAAELAAADDGALVDAVVVNADADTAYGDLCAALAPHVGAAVAPAARPQAAEYLQATVVPALRQALAAVNAARPADPLAHLIEQLQRLTAGGAPAPSVA